jgi:hypothetical protein
MTKDQCATKCKAPAKIFSCNTTVGKCQVVPPGHPGQPNSICSANCTKHKPVKMAICNNQTLTCEIVNGSNPQGAQPADKCAKEYVRYSMHLQRKQCMVVMQRRKSHLL